MDPDDLPQQGKKYLTIFGEHICPNLRKSLCHTIGKIRGSILGKIVCIKLSKE